MRRGPSAAEGGRGAPRGQRPGPGSAVRVRPQRATRRPPPATREMPTDDGALTVAMSKGRSASICAPGFSSMEAVAAAAAAAAAGGGGGSGSGGGGGTPVAGRRRRPAARSQSARLTGGKSVRRRAAAGAAGGGGEGMRGGVSEPRLAGHGAEGTPPPAPGLGLPAAATPEASPGFRRRGSSRRSVHHAHGHGHGHGHAHGHAQQPPPRKSAAYLDVPDALGGPLEGEDDESYRLRSFSLTSKGRRRPPPTCRPPSVYVASSPICQTY
ncbi:hapless 2-like [Schistocerca americana]|uniref:hapless 2-like n=1 Tax=Schistocerca americana TaxID=7009 RepID=UPI001F4FC0B2|nr:hapless 2-like [Schistocerca americana]